VSDDDIRARIKADMIRTLREHQGPRAFVSGPMVDALVDDALFHLEAATERNSG
jgi:hypothetical protein